MLRILNSNGKQFGFASLYVDKHISYCRQRAALWAVISRHPFFIFTLLKVGDKGIEINIGFMCGDAGRCVGDFFTFSIQLNVARSEACGGRPANGL